VSTKRDRRLHAARVAAVATAVVMVCYFTAVIALNLLVVHRLTAQADTRLSQRLVEAGRPTLQISGTPQTPTDRDHDIDEAPTFIWSVSMSGTSSARTAGSPALPDRAWETGAVTVDVKGTPFRFQAVKSGTGWLIAGESLAQLDRVQSALLVPEILFGIALVFIVFVGSLIIGLRASAPLELVQRRQAEFTADASHELRTPLSVIEAEVDLALSKSRTTNDYQAVLQRIAGEGQRLRRIVDDLLWLARIDDEKTDAHASEEADVAAIATACAGRFQPIAEARLATLGTAGIESGPLLVRTDPSWIDRLLGVLVDNACKYAGTGGHVEVSVRGMGSRVVLRVDDSGPGIPASQRSLVFDRFHRGTDELGGSGLGLAIADSVVRASNGTWLIGAAPSGGARMQVSWKRTATSHPRAPGADERSDDIGPGSLPSLPTARRPTTDVGQPRRIPASDVVSEMPAD
jgi:signal transduction histidine kinase